MKGRFLSGPIPLHPIQRGGATDPDSRLEFFLQHAANDGAAKPAPQARCVRRVRPLPSRLLRSKITAGATADHGAAAQRGVRW